MTHDAPRLGPLAQELTERLLEYGVTNDPALVDPISVLYARAIAELSEETRMEIVLSLSQLAEDRKISGNPLFPFLLRDPAPTIVSTAALNLAIFWPSGGDHPLAGVRYIAEQARGCADRGEGDRAAAILAGLLVLADRRVTEDLRGCWRWLPTIEGRAGLLSALTSVIVQAPVVEWLIDWLEDCEGQEFGMVAGALSRLSRVAWVKGVVELQRALPVWSATRGEPLHEISRWSFAEFGERIQARLEHVAVNESEPRVMHRVLEEWGLGLYGPPPTRDNVPGRIPTTAERRPLLGRMPQDAVRRTTQLHSIALSEEDFAAHGGDLLLCWGIFSPSGPTWCCLGRVRTENPDVDLLFYRMLNPFSQDSVAISSLVGIDRTDARALSYILSTLFKGNTITRVVAGASAGRVRMDEERVLLMETAPTFVLIPWDVAEFRNAVSDFFKTSPAVLSTNLAQNIEYMTRYWGRPWDRTAAERDDALAHHLASGNFDDLLQKYPGLGALATSGRPQEAQLPSSQRGPADAPLVEQWYELIRNREHLARELSEFPNAWRGAIDVHNDSPLAQDAYALERLDGFLLKFGCTVFHQAETA